MMRSWAYNRLGVLMGTSWSVSCPHWHGLRDNSLPMITPFLSQGGFCATAPGHIVVGHHGGMTIRRAGEQLECSVRGGSWRQTTSCQADSQVVEHQGWPRVVRRQMLNQTSPVKRRAVGNLTRYQCIAHVATNAAEQRIETRGSCQHGFG